MPGCGCSELGVVAVGPTNVTYHTAGSESLSWVCVWKRTSREGEVGVCLYLHPSQHGAMGDARAGVERRREPAAELPGLREDVGDAASRVTRSYFGLCLYLKIVNAETSCLKVLDVLTSELQRAQAVRSG